MKKVFWISLMAPYDGVAHAGGKIHNYLLKYLNNEKNIDITLLTFASEKEKEYIDNDHYHYNIKSKIHYFKEDKINRIGRKTINHIFFLSKLAGKGSFLNRKTLKRKIKEYKKQNDDPDYVILHWTSIINNIGWIKKEFPNAKFIVIEEDVTFLKVYRKIISLKGIKRIVSNKIYGHFKKNEVASLTLSNLIIVNNDKDRLLLENEKINNNILSISPYFTNFDNLKYKYKKENILFYGAMNRPENYEAAIWFIESVFYKLKKYNKDFKFIVLGGNPNKKLLSYESNDIIITGFVDKIDEYFSDSLCLVAPLLMGAGVKIKILEGLSSGIPVLTNEIGIEGIPAKEGRDFLLSKKPEDYISNILELTRNKDFTLSVSKNAKEFIKKNYNYKKSAEQLKKYILDGEIH
ncbi:glycosyltransferase [Dubosiella newyorkensis]|uniref:Glycosyl transferase family 1 domain-containing protein n=1 Tax=Dubosiella newyorkensis TaxID=1862672 RepID=A0A1U7NKJ1_9FIRM|nr:glycosyltransferase [Dubosiella newyorkensis]OLU44769.1 hypothetical protein BO225_09835 [Dubosiella newyorkensis]